MKNVFLDLGTHYGQGMREFIQKFNMDESWIIHTFEANPVTFKVFTENYHKHTPWVISHNQAISDHNGEIKVNIETPPGEGETGMGTSVIDLSEWNPWGGQLRENFKYHAITPCVDLSEFIINNFNKSDNIIVKMDIEGAEYDTLEKMIETGAIDYVNFIAVEWHSRFFVSKDAILERENIIIDYMKNHNINLESWK